MLFMWTYLKVLVSVTGQCRDSVSKVQGLQFLELIHLLLLDPCMRGLLVK